MASAAIQPAADAAALPIFRVQRFSVSLKFEVEELVLLTFYDTPDRYDSASRLPNGSVIDRSPRRCYMRLLIFDDL